jgi:predicted esterase
MKRFSALVLLMLPTLAARAVLHFGTNEIPPGVLVEFTTPFNGRASFEASKARLPGSLVRAALVLPAGCTNLLKPCPLLIVSVPSGGSALNGMRAMTNIALREGWAVLAADGPRVAEQADTIQLGWGMLSSALDQLSRTWPRAKQWPVACAGFSGGAKRSAAVAAAMTHDGWHVTGVFMGGCNEDRASLGQQLFSPGPAFKRVPLFLSNGEQDPIAGPQPGAAVRDSMLRSGFTTVRMETYPGGHRLHEEHLRDALRWFRENEPKPPGRR